MAARSTSPTSRPTTPRSAGRRRADLSPRHHPARARQRGGVRPAGGAPIDRLATTLLDSGRVPALELAALYHERWEIETAQGELKTHLRGAGIVLRSRTPDLARQEFYGLMMAHFAVRCLIHEATLRADEDPDRLSFLHAVRVIRRKLPHATALPPSPPHSLP